jgi:hypothetical protein
MARLPWRRASGRESRGCGGKGIKTGKFVGIYDVSGLIKWGIILKKFNGTVLRQIQLYLVGK